ncbi:hypothetical protein HDE_10339 [Halotydeus destructor]|nr:hypothetical protein HDE_10339 [Halotydeus destructor]
MFTKTYMEEEETCADRNKSSVELDSSSKTIDDAATAEREASEYLKEQALAERAREQQRQQASVESRTKLADIERRIAEATRGVEASGEFLIGLASKQREELKSRHTPTFGGVGEAQVSGTGVGGVPPPVVPQLV